MAKDKSVSDKYNKDIEELDASLDKLKGDLGRKVNGISPETKGLLDIDEDISSELLKDIGSMGYETSKKHLMDMVGKDSNTGQPMGEVMLDTLKNLEKFIAMDPTYQERVMLEQEYNYLCANMPQLLFSAEEKVNNIISPDGITKSFLNFTLKDNTNRVTMNEINNMVANKDLEPLIKDTYTKTFIGGTKYIYVVPHREIANRLLDRYGERNDLIKQSPNMISSTKMIDLNEDDYEIISEAIDDIVYNDGGDGEDRDGELIAESSDIFNSDEETEDISAYFSENHMVDDVKDDLAYQLNSDFKKLANKDYNSDDDFELISEAKNPFKSITGCHVSVLENDRIIPIVVDRKIIGMYYIETMGQSTGQNMGYEMSNMTGSKHISDTRDRENRHNQMLQKVVIKKISRVIKNNLDEKKIKKNHHIVSTLEKVLHEHDKFNGDVKVRFIPRKYFVPLTVNKDNEGMGRSQLHRARITAHMWILMNQSNLMNKLLYEKDRMVIESKMGQSTDTDQIARRALDSVMKMYPTPLEMMDISKTHKRMSRVGTLLNPVSKNGESALDINRIQGQEKEEDYEFKKDLEHISTLLVGIPFSLTDMRTNTDYATNLISQDSREVNSTISFQIELEKALSELITKIVSFEKDVDINIKVTLPKPKSLSDSMQGEILNNQERKAETIANVRAGDDQKKAKYIKSKYFEHLTGANIDWELIERFEEEYETEEGEDDGDQNSDGYGGYH